MEVMYLMAEESRTKKTIRNTMFSFGYKFVDIVLAFALRTLFIRALGISYLGISGLFTNILTVLSLMELGVGSAIVFSLYKPLAVGEKSKVAALMNLYKKVYNCIGVLILFVGAALTPFLHYIINLPTDIDHIYIIYWLTIANTSVTYFLAYRRSLLMADQRSDINTKNLILFRFIRFVVLIIVLLSTHNYVIYLLSDVLITIASNIQISLVIKKRYKDIEEAKPCPLSKEEKNNIYKYMTSGIFSKIGQTVVTSTDNILISAFISTILVGIYSNYSMVTSNLEVFVYLLFNGITASVGNFAVTNSGKDSSKLFKRINFANYGIAFIVTVCVFALISPFVTIWAGKEYVLSDFTVSIICLNFYIALMQKSIENFMSAVGKMFYINRYRSIIEAVVNLTVSICLVQFTDWGITGVFLGTTVCFLCGRIWMDAHTLYKYWFKEPFIDYLIIYIKRLFLTVFCAVAGRYFVIALYNCLSLSVLTFCLSAVLTFSMSVFIFCAIYYKSEDFRYYLGLLKQIVNKISSGVKD